MYVYVYVGVYVGATKSTTAQLKESSTQDALPWVEFSPYSLQLSVRSLAAERQTEAGSSFSSQQCFQSLQKKKIIKWMLEGKIGPAETLRMFSLHRFGV